MHGIYRIYNTDQCHHAQLSILMLFPFSTFYIKVHYFLAWFVFTYLLKSEKSISPFSLLLSQFTCINYTTTFEALVWPVDEEPRDT